MPSSSNSSNVQHFYFNRCIESDYYDDIKVELSSNIEKIINNNVFLEDRDYSKVYQSRNGNYILYITSNNIIYLRNNTTKKERKLDFGIYDIPNIKKVIVGNNGVVLFHLSSTKEIKLFNYNKTKNGLIIDFLADEKKPYNVLDCQLNHLGTHFVVSTSNSTKKNRLYVINSLSSTISLIESIFDNILNNIKEFQFSYNSNILSVVTDKSELILFFNSTGNIYKKINTTFEELYYEKNLSISLDNSSLTYMNSNGSLKIYSLTNNGDGYTTTLKTFEGLDSNITKNICLKNSKVLIYKLDIVYLINVTTSTVITSFQLEESYDFNYFIDFYNNHIYYKLNNTVYSLDFVLNVNSVLNNDFINISTYLNFSKDILKYTSYQMMETISNIKGEFYYVHDNKLKIMVYDYIKGYLKYNSLRISSENYYFENNYMVIKKEWLRENFTITNLKRFEIFKIEIDIFYDITEIDITDPTFINFTKIDFDIEFYDVVDVVYFDENDNYFSALYLNLDKYKDIDYKVQGYFGTINQAGGILREDNLIKTTYNSVTNQFTINYKIFSKKSINSEIYKTITLVKIDKNGFNNTNVNNFSKTDPNYLHKFYENQNNNLIKLLAKEQSIQLTNYSLDVNSAFNVSPFEIEYTLTLSYDDYMNNLLYLVTGDHNTSNLIKDCVAKDKLELDELSIDRFQTKTIFQKINNTTSEIIYEKILFHDLLAKNSNYTPPVLTFSKENYSTDSDGTKIYDSGINLLFQTNHNKFSNRKIRGYIYLNFIKDINVNKYESYSFTKEIDSGLKLPYDRFELDSNTVLSGKKNVITISSGNETYNNVIIDEYNNYLIENGKYKIHLSTQNDYQPTIKYIQRDTITFISNYVDVEFKIIKRNLTISPITYTVNRNILTKDNKSINSIEYIFYKISNQDINFYSGLSLAELDDSLILKEYEGYFSLKCSDVGNFKFLLRTNITGLEGSYIDEEFEFKVEEETILNYSNVFDYTKHYSNDTFVSTQYNDIKIDFRKDRFNRIVEETYPLFDVNSFLNIEYFNFKGDKINRIFDRDVPLYLFGSSALTVIERGKLFSNNALDFTELKKISSLTTSYDYAFSNFDFFSRPSTPLVTISPLDEDDIVMTDPIKYHKNALVIFQNLVSSEYESEVYLNGKLIEIIDDRLLIQQPGYYNLNVIYTSNLNYLISNYKVEFEILKNNQVPPYIKYSNITATNITVDISYLYSTKEKDTIYDSTNRLTFPTEVANNTFLKNYPPVFKQEVEVKDSNLQYLINLNGTDSVVTTDVNGNYNFVMGINDTLIAKKKFYNNQISDSTIDISVDLLDEIPTAPKINIILTGPNKSVAFPVIEKELGYDYIITLNGKNYQEGLPITLFNGNVKEFELKVEVINSTNIALKNSATVKFTIDTTPPEIPRIKINEEEIVNNKIYNLSKAEFRPIIINKEPNVRYYMIIENKTFDITVDNYHFNEFLNNLTEFNKLYNVVLYSKKTSNGMVSLNTYYFEISNNDITDLFYTDTGNRNVLIPSNNLNNIFKYPGEFVVDIGTGDLSIVTDELNDEKRYGYKLNNITEDIKMLAPNNLISRYRKNLLYHNSKLNYFKGSITTLKENNITLKELLGSSEKIDLSILENGIDDTNITSKISNIQTLYQNMVNILVLDVTYSIKGTNYSFIKAVEKFKSGIITSSVMDNLIHISDILTPTETIKENLLDLIETYYDLFEIYVKCKYNLVNLEKLTNDKVKKTDFEAFKITQNKYFDNLEKYLNDTIGGVV